MRTSFWKNERGSALILVVLLGLVMSAMAIIALRNITYTTQAAAVYRTRTQAQMTSDSVVRMYSGWLGQNAATTLAAANARLEHELRTAADETERSQAATRGARLERGADEVAEMPFSPLADVNPSGKETGLFLNADGQQTFESRHTLDWRVQVRDLIDGYPAIYYGDQFCFSKATIAAEATVGEVGVDDDWKGPNNIAVTRHVIDGMVGPRDCGYNR